MEPKSIVGKIVVTGNLHLISPLIIGSGQDEFADIEVIKDSDGNPFIPATSLVGVLKHYFYENSSVIPDNADLFWGFSRKNEQKKQESVQSAFICHDLFPIKANIKIRDGVKIDPKWQVAQDTGKYDYEVIENGAKFKLYWEVTLRNIHNKDTFKKILKTNNELLKNGNLSMGAKTNSGFGKCKLKNLSVSQFDFSKKTDVLRWLKQDFSESTPYLDCGAYTMNNNTFFIEAKFAVKNSIIIRSYSEEANMPDATSIQSNGKYVLPGTSVKGAIRHRALKILKTLDIDNPEKRINELFGIAGKNINSRKGRVLIEEREIIKLKPEIQNRIKIDRFTGGTIKTALFNSMPLWNSDQNTESITIIIKIRDYKDKYLFSWEKVPGIDSVRLIEFLMQNFNIEWIKTAKINKNDDGKTIRITNDTNFISLTLNNEKNNVNIEIDDGRTDKFIVKTENGELNIYKDKEWEAGLILQVLKDLWSEDLPIGGEKNVGRGVLKGISARIKWDGKDLTIKQDEKGLVFSDKSHAKELAQLAEMLGGKYDES